MKCEVFL